MAKKKECFVIAPIGEPGSPTRERSDKVLKYVVEKAADACGYKALRADEIAEPGIITNQVIQHIIDAPLVLADLTECNPNVFYELAIRHVQKKPLIQIIEKGQRIPFDVAVTRTIYVDHRDLDSVEEAKAKIIEQIKAVEADPDAVDNPISMAVDLKALRESGDADQRSTADIVAGLVELREMVGEIAAVVGGCLHRGSVLGVTLPPPREWTPLVTLAPGITLPDQSPPLDPKGGGILTGFIPATAGPLGAEPGAPLDGVPDDSP